MPEITIPFYCSPVLVRYVVTDLINKSPCDLHIVFFICPGSSFHSMDFGCPDASFDHNLSHQYFFSNQLVTKNTITHIASWVCSRIIR